MSSIVGVALSGMLVLSVVNNSLPLLTHPFVKYTVTALAVAVPLQYAVLLALWGALAPVRLMSEESGVGAASFAEFVTVNVSGASTMAVTVLCLLCVFGATSAAWVNTTLLPLLRETSALYVEPSSLEPCTRPPQDLRRPKA